MAEFVGIALAVLGVFSILLNVARGGYDIFLRAEWNLVNSNTS